MKKRKLAHRLAKAEERLELIAERLKFVIADCDSCQRTIGRCVHLAQEHKSPEDAIEPVRRVGFLDFPVEPCLHTA